MNRMEDYDCLHPHEPVIVSAFLKNLRTLPRIQIDARDPELSIVSLAHECQEVFKSSGKVVEHEFMYEFRALRQKILTALETSMAFKAFFVSRTPETFLYFFPDLENHHFSFYIENDAIFNDALKHFPVFKNYVASMAGAYDMEALVELVMILTADDTEEYVYIGEEASDPETPSSKGQTPTEDLDFYIDAELFKTLALNWKGLTAKGLQLFSDSMDSFDQSYPSLMKDLVYDYYYLAVTAGFEESIQSQINDVLFEEGDIEPSARDPKEIFEKFRSRAWPQVAQGKHARSSVNSKEISPEILGMYQECVRRAGCEDDFWGVEEFSSSKVVDSDLPASTASSSMPKDLKVGKDAEVSKAERDAEVSKAEKGAEVGPLNDSTPLTGVEAGKKPPGKGKKKKSAKKKKTIAGKELMKSGVLNQIETKVDTSEQTQGNDSPEAFSNTSSQKSLDAPSEEPATKPKKKKSKKKSKKASKTPPENLDMKDGGSFADVGLNEHLKDVVPKPAKKLPESPPKELVNPTLPTSQSNQSETSHSNVNKASSKATQTYIPAQTESSAGKTAKGSKKPMKLRTWLPSSEEQLARKLAALILRRPDLCPNCLQKHKLSACPNIADDPRENVAAYLVTSYESQTQHQRMPHQERCAMRLNRQKRSKKSTQP